MFVFSRLSLTTLGGRETRPPTASRLQIGFLSARHFFSPSGVGPFLFLVESGANDFKLRTLILHRSSNILVPHCLHHRRQIPRVRQDPRAVVVPAAIQHRVLRKTDFARASRNGRPTSVRWPQFDRLDGNSHPSLPHPLADHIAHAIAHGNHLSTFSRLAVRHKDDSSLELHFDSRNDVKLFLRNPLAALICRGQTITIHR